jgi:nucleotide-binding universal stress UspA family protein
MDTTLDSILVAVGTQKDEDIERLIEATLQVAVPTDATVVLSHVFTQEEFEEAAERLEYPSATADEVNAVLGRHQRVRDFKNALEEHGVDYEIRGSIGEVTEQLVATAEDIAADRVIITGHRRSPTGKAVFGSLSQDILLQAPCPVTYVKVD